MKSASCETVGRTFWWAGMVGWVGFSLVAVAPCPAQDGNSLLEEWRITPRLSVGATYSDNIRLAPADDAEGDLVLQVAPGVSMLKQGGRLDLRLDYTAQGLLYANTSDASTIEHGLLAFGTAELYQDHFFVDAYGSISQVPVTSGDRVDAGSLGGGSGNSGSAAGVVDWSLNVLPGAGGLIDLKSLFGDFALSGNNQTTAASFGISPYWRQRFGGWAEALLRYRYDDTGYGESGFDSKTHSVEFNLTSGRQFSVLQWNLDYSYSRQEGAERGDQELRGNENNNERESVAGQLSYRLSSSWSLLSEAGYENNQLTNFEESNNGFYWGAGARWTPNRFYSMTALYGLNINEIAMQWAPSARTNLQISRRDQSVGADPGVRWEGSFNHRARYVTWSARYSQEVTNNQRLLSDDLVGVGPDGRPIILDPQGRPVAIDQSFGLSNENFRRKRFEAGATYLRGRTGLNFNIFNEDREFQDAASNETARGVGALWAWRFAPRTASFLGIGWEEDDLGDDQQNNYWVSVIGLARVFTPDSGGLISYRYYQNDADPSDQGFRENRLNVRFSMKF